MVLPHAGGRLRTAAGPCLEMGRALGAGADLGALESGAGLPPTRIAGRGLLRAVHAVVRDVSTAEADARGWLLVPALVTALASSTAPPRR